MISKPPRLPRRRCSGGLWRLPRKGFSSEPPPSKRSAVGGKRSKRTELWCLWNQPFRNHTPQSLFVCLKKIVFEPFFGAPANSGDPGDFGASGDAGAGFCREFSRILKDFGDFPEIPEASEGFSGIFKGFPLPGDCPACDFPLKFFDFRDFIEFS